MFPHSIAPTPKKSAGNNFLVLPEMLFDTVLVTRFGTCPALRLRVRLNGDSCWVMSSSARFCEWSCLLEYMTLVLQRPICSGYIPFYSNGELRSTFLWQRCSRENILNKSVKHIFLPQLKRNIHQTRIARLVGGSSLL